MPRAPGKPYCIAIAGASGSGKSWLTKHLAGLVPATVIALDSYYRDLSALPLAERARQNFDAPEALDWDLLVPQIEQLAQGRAIGPHGKFFDLREKYALLHEGGANPYIDPNGYQAHIKLMEQSFYYKLDAAHRQAGR